MARKSKKLKTNTSAVGHQNIDYQGRITLSINRGNKTIMKKEYHNSGMPNLFRYLANVLAGNSTSELRPVKIKLFRYPGADSTEGLTPANFSWSKAWTDNLDLMPVQVSPFILYDTTPTIKRVVNDVTATGTVTEDDYHYETTYHFRIPFSYISASMIHMIGLYPNNAVDHNSDATAYYLFTDETGKEWEPLELDESVGNYSIVVEWTLSLSNKVKTAA